MAKSNGYRDVLPGLDQCRPGGVVLQLFRSQEVMSVKDQEQVMDITGISAIAKSVLHCLAFRAKNGTCYPSLSRLATDTCLSLASVKRALNELDSQNLIKRDRGRTGKATEYTLNLGARVAHTEPSSYRAQAHTEPEGGSHRALGRLTQSPQPELTVNNRKEHSTKTGTKVCPDGWDFSEVKTWAEENTPLTPAQINHEIELCQNHEFKRTYTHWNRVAKNWLKRAQPDSRFQAKGQFVC